MQIKCILNEIFVKCDVKFQSKEILKNVERRSDRIIYDRLKRACRSDANARLGYNHCKLEERYEKDNFGNFIAIYK